MKDEIFGAGGNDIIRGQAGNDYLNGGEGNDQVYGGAGDDKIWDDVGNDRLYGDAGDDTFILNAGFNTVVGGEGVDLLDLFNVTAGVRFSLVSTRFKLGIDLTTYRGIEGVYGTKFDDTLLGASRDDRLFGGDGDDSLGGNAGNDILNGGNGRDHIFAGAGNDIIVASPGGKVIYGDSGRDLLDLFYATAGVTLTLDKGVVGYRIEGKLSRARFESLEDITGSSKEDNLKGNASGNRFRGADGDDRLNGVAGDDILSGQNGNDTLTGGKGSDSFIFSSGSDLASGIRDRITDFDATADRLVFDSNIFTTLKAQGVQLQHYDLDYFAIDSSQFDPVSASSASDGSIRIFYNTASGIVYYDADGSGTASAAMAIAFIGRGQNLGVEDIFVI